MKILIVKILKNTYIKVLLLSFVLSFFVGCCLVHVNAESCDYFFSEVEFSEKYYVGDELNIGKIQLHVGGKTIDSISVVYAPDGSAKTTDKVKFTMIGQYTIGFRAQVGRKLYSKDTNIDVINSLYSVGNQDSSVKYGEDESRYQTGKKGILLSLKNNDIFTFNQIIDLRKLTKEDTLIQLFSTPITQGAYDARRFYVTLTDAYNSDLYVAIRLQCYPYDGGAWSYRNSYATIEFTGYTSSTDFGIPMNHSFYAKGYYPIGEEFIKLSYDIDKNTVYANNSCANDTDDKYGCLTNDNVYPVSFQGFTTGEVYLSIYGIDYAAPSMNMIITDIAGVNLNKKDINYDSSALIKVDTGVFDENNLPNGILNKPYPVFKAKAVDAYTDKVNVETKVFYNYNNISRYELNIIDGKFYPNEIGIYTIEYTAINAFNQKTIKSIEIEVYTTGSNIGVSIDTSSLVKACVVGETISLGCFGKEVIVDKNGCGVGSLNYDMKVEKDGKAISVTKNILKPMEKGIYKVTYIVKDMLLQEAKVEYDINVNLSDKPVFSEEIVLPKYFIANKTYNLPIVHAYDFSKNEKVIAELHVTDVKGNELKITNNSFIPRFSNDSFINVYYVATNTKGNTKIEKLNIPVRVVSENNKINLTRYFDTNGGKVIANDEEIVFSNNKNMMITYINPLLASTWSIDFSIDSTKNYFKSFDIYLSDYDNLENSIKLSILKANSPNDLTYLYNESKKGEGNVTHGFFDDGNIRLNYDKGNLSIKYGQYSMPITLKQDGELFEGFKSEKIYMSFAMNDVEGESSIRLYKINSNTFSNDTKDYVEPEIEIFGYSKINNKLNDIITIYSAIAVDVLDVNTTIKVSVMYNSKAVTSVDGVVMHNVFCGKEYKIKLSEYGKYIISYTYEDTLGNSNIKNISVYAEDTEPPQIDETNSIELKALGEEYVLKDVTATDNLDENVKVRCIVSYPDGKSAVYKKDILVLNQVGKYIVTYYAVDISNNYSLITKIINVR